MRLRIDPWLFLGKLVVLLFVAYWAWMPLAPAYTRVLLRASQVGVWLSELSTDPAWSHQTELLIRPDISPTAIFFYQRAMFPPYGLDPQGIPAEWIMANLVLLVPLMLATPAPTWRTRIVRLALALAIALLLQVFDVVVGIKSYYAATFPNAFSAFSARLYQFLDAFVQSWDTQLFPFLIWAGIHLRQLLPAALVPEAAPAAAASASRAERRRHQARDR
ncbi:hypothetical protein KF840_25890 [bacterium]|nr:hypothetical protein [bacterium]